MNFVCAARSRGFDISNIIVFTTDKETTELAESLGLATYYDHRVRALQLVYLGCASILCFEFLNYVYKSILFYRTLATFLRKQQSATGTRDSLP